tara:strand:+ start:67 stop:456 length:390 start_codon:yes stop_codon:yes gene_type:complete
MPKAVAGGLEDGTRVARIGVIAPKLQTLSMIDMCKMGKAAWMRLGHAILGGCFPQILNLMTENHGSILNHNKTVERTRPAMLALTAFCSQRIADVDHKRAMDALNEPSKSAKKKMKAQQGAGATNTVPQ